MAEAVERETVELIERIPHPTVAYAYVEVRASNANAFMAARNEFLRKHEMYAFALNTPAAPKKSPAPEAGSRPAEETAPEGEGDEPRDRSGQGTSDVSPVADSPAQSAPTSGPEQSAMTAREKARARMLARKES